VPALTEAEVIDLIDKRTLLTRNDVDTIVTESEIGRRPDGTPLYILVKDCIPHEFCVASYPVALRVATNPISGGSRAIAAASYMELRTRKDGSKGKRYEVAFRPHLKGAKDGLLGFVADGYPDGKLNCRRTSFTRRHWEKHEEFRPLSRRVAEVFCEYLPERYAVQAAAANLVEGDFIIEGTPFSTVTVNRNWQTAVHTDQGDFKSGFGALTLLTAGEFSGGQLIFPRYRVAVDFQMQDVLLADVHEPHGNLPILGADGEYHRISLVFYLRENMMSVCPAARPTD